MERSSPSEKGTGFSPACRAEQLYITHCRRDDSVLGQEGFGVRAASSAEPKLLQFALELPAHELPADAGNLGLTPAHSPRRLARIDLSDGRVALVHSTYVSRDTRGRDDSYFTHALVYDRLKPVEALRAWAAPQWRCEYPLGAAKELSRFEGIPVGSALDDGNLADFLDSTAAPVDSLVSPECLRAAPPRRRDWLRLVLAACLRTLHASEGGRKHVYIRAEPGVVALLLYGVVRLLPEALGSQLTFSTYERPGESLRELGHARVLGTWTASRQPWPDADHLQRRGYPLDLWHDPIETELWDDVSPGIDRLVALAAARDWAAVEEVHALWQSRPSALCGDLTETALAQPVLQRMRSRPATRADVAELAGRPLGRELLTEAASSVWPLVWEHCLDDATSRDYFTDLLRQHRAELEERLAAILATPSSPAWSQQWALLRAVLPAEETSASFRRVLRATRGDDNGERLPSFLRLELLREWQTVEPRLTFVPEEHAGLLDAATPGELTGLVAAGLPQRWVGQALTQALTDARREREVVALLAAETPGVASGFCAAVTHLHGDNADELLAPLLPAGKPQAIARFALLQNAGLSLDPAVLERLLRRAEVVTEPWLQYWLQGENLTWLGRALPPQNALLRQIWAVYTRNIRKKYLLGDNKQAALVARLQAAHEGLGDLVPLEAANVLNDWSCLRAQLRDPPEANDKRVAALAEAARRRGIKSPFALLKHGFAAALSAAERMSEEELRRIVRGVTGFYGPSVEKAFAVLLALVADCPGPLRSTYQRFFLSCAAPQRAAALVERYRDRLELADGGIEELLILRRRRERRRRIGLLLGILVVAGLVGAALWIALR